MDVFDYLQVAASLESSGPLPVENFSAYRGLCIVCHEPGELNIPYLCEPCRTNFWQKAESYGGDYDEILARVSGYIAAYR